MRHEKKTGREKYAIAVAFVLALFSSLVSLYFQIQHPYMKKEVIFYSLCICSLSARYIFVKSTQRYVRALSIVPIVLTFWSQLSLVWPFLKFIALLIFFGIVGHFQS